MMGRLLGIDHGNARIGLAVSDALGITATELTIIHRQSKAEDFAQIAAIAKREAVVAFVIGIPNNEQRPEQHSQADTVRQWIAQLQDVVPYPIIEWDEQLTSVDARAIAIRLKRKMRAPIDDLAARVILQSYLNALHNGLAPPPPQAT